ncbi:hypothetical protein K7W42_22415 [Deinococcus sp. HMF7604]|uniref:hypothetical protein n=1 Tax=Deinococcus betulae TaxID=2873312 RepID=UPI001CCC4D62|nr:hypothetical protein [Deinococcus betulae]MBZ9753586.1 hypothetical protein [Deinococcus betulae]
MFDAAQEQGLLYSNPLVQGGQHFPQLLRAGWTPKGQYSVCMFLNPSDVAVGQPFEGYAFTSLPKANAYVLSGKPGSAPRCTLTLAK